MEKKRTLGLKIIFFYLSLTIIFGYSLLFATVSFLKSSIEKKTQLMQASTFKGYYFKSIEELDNFHKEKIKSMVNPWWISVGVIQLILAFGLWYLNKWARIGTILYSILAILMAILWFLPGVITSVATQVSKLFSLIVFGYITYYLTRPKVKELFK